MNNYDDLKQLADSSKNCDICNTAKGDWELKKEGTCISLKYKGVFVILHSPEVSVKPTVCKNAVQMFDLDCKKMMSILGIDG